MITTPQDFIPAYEQALASQDWEVIAPLIHPGCVATFTEGTYHGKTQVEAAFRKTFALIQDEKYALSEVHWVTNTASYAVMTYIFSWSGLINGKPASGSGRGTSVLVRENMQWLLLCEHLGPLPR